MDAYSVSSDYNDDVDLFVNINYWVRLYPDGVIRGVVRDANKKTVYEWSTSGDSPYPRSYVNKQLVVDKYLLVVKMPTVDAESIGAIAGSYEFRISDPNGANRKMFGGSFTLTAPGGITV